MMTHTCETPSLAAYVAQKTGSKNWCVAARVSSRTRGRDAVITPAQFDRLQADYLQDGGDPWQCDRRVLEAMGWRQVWVAPTRKEA